MFNDHSVKPLHSLVNIVTIIFGGWVASHPGYGNIGILIITMSVIYFLFLLVRDSINERNNMNLNEMDLIKARQKALDNSDKMTPDQKAEAGLIDVPGTSKFTIFHHGEAQQLKVNFPILSISPVKLKLVCQACVRGEVFSIREMSGTGKLITDTEFRNLKDELISYGLLEYRKSSSPTLGFNWTASGIQFINALAEE